MAIFHIQMRGQDLLHFELRGFHPFGYGHDALTRVSVDCDAEYTVLAHSSGAVITVLDADVVLMQERPELSDSVLTRLLSLHDRKLESTSKKQDQCTCLHVPAPEESACVVLCLGQDVEFLAPPAAEQALVPAIHLRHQDSKGLVPLLPFRRQHRTVGSRARAIGINGVDVLLDDDFEESPEDLDAWFS
jgi:hypothetical protein